MNSTTNSLPAADISGITGYFNGSPVPAFAIDRHHVVIKWNSACEKMTGVTAAEMIGTRKHWTPFYDAARPLLADLIVDAASEATVNAHYFGNAQPSTLTPSAYDAVGFFPHLAHGPAWLRFSASPLFAQDGTVVGAMEILQDVTKQKVAEEALLRIQEDLECQVVQRTAELLRRNAELTEAYERLSSVQQQLVQSDKLASIGQLAAGVAHEINNPIGYIFSNFGTLETYLASLMEMLDVYEQSEVVLGAGPVRDNIRAVRERIELDYLKEDIPVMMRESMEGIVRVRQIVQDLKDFSRVDNFMEWQWTNLHRGIDSTLNIVSNEVKYTADVVRDYGTLPDIECLPSQLNQVIMNLIVNAAQAIGPARGTITIRTRCSEDTDDSVSIEISDTGSGISTETQARIFDPFFTTKAIGKGTGLGLSMAYGIIQKHRGQITVESVVGTGSTFRITLPIHQPATDPH
ncbi:MAG: PAS domain-containing protein [Oxalobacteraceae bacterium]|nr:PAS domain-containing protein [Oxalobacteraceae bacterium]